ncbi:hypothetical protein AB0J63_26855 [Streptosporangium canum]|uniref:hypothetical protein n=1 Tax=Streptosporangium canum TaxID=324952 RepID=UPI003422F8D9
MNELALTESPSLRAQYADRVDVLDKVGKLRRLPNDVRVTTEMVANYYEVGVEAIKSVVKDNRAELEANGYKVLTGRERAEFVRSLGDLTLPPARHLALFPPRAILNVGQLLRDSEIAKEVRTALLDAGERETGQAVAPALPEPSRKELAQYWYEAEQRAEVEAARAVKAESRARAIEGKFREFEGGDGITLTKFHKKHFSEVGERTFFEHLYSRHYLIDQRSKGSEREDGTRRDGPEHAHPGAKGKQFLYLHEGGVHGGRRRHRTYVRPGDPELLFKAALVRDGLRGNQHVVGQLFAIEGGAS